MRSKLITLLIVSLILTFFCASPVLADNHAHIVVTASSYVTFPCHPENLITTITGKNCFNMSWDKGKNSPSTLIVLCKENAHNCDLSDIGNLSDSCWIVYNGSGTSFDLPSCGLEFDLYQYYVTAWGYDGGNYSATCINMQVKGDDSMMILWILLFLASVATFFAFRLREILITMGAAIGWLTILLFALSSDHEFVITNMWVVSFVLGIICLIVGVLLVYMRREVDEYGRMVNREKETRSESQISQMNHKRELRAMTSRYNKKKGWR